MKKGDYVFAIKNKVWGIRPMKVTEVGHTYVHARHPDFGLGCFPRDSIISAETARGKARAKKLKVIATMQDKIIKQLRPLFKDKE